MTIYILMNCEKIVDGYTDEDMANDEAKKKNKSRDPNTNAYYYVKPLELIGGKDGHKGIQP